MYSMRYRAGQEAIEQGVNPDEMRGAAAWRGSGMLISAEGHLSGQESMAALPAKAPERLFCAGRQRDVQDLHQPRQRE